jgi:hypothetical protein
MRLPPPCSRFARARSRLDQRSESASAAYAGAVNIFGHTADHMDSRATRRAFFERVGLVERRGGARVEGMHEVTAPSEVAQCNAGMG